MGWLDDDMIQFMVYTNVIHIKYQKLVFLTQHRYVISMCHCSVCMRIPPRDQEI
jgi:hypothetical protein